MMRAPADRASRLVRLGLVLDCVAAATLPWVDKPAQNWEWAHTALAFLAAALLALSVVVPRHLPRLAFDPALTLAAIVLLAHGTYVWLIDDVDAALTLRGALFSIGGGVTALGLMVARQNDVWRERRAVRR